MTELFDEIGVEVTKENMTHIDEIIHDILSVHYRNCAATWKLVRKKLVDDSEGFKKRVQEVLSEFR